MLLIVAIALLSVSPLVHGTTTCPPVGGITDQRAWLGFVDSIEYTDDRCSQHAGVFSYLIDGSLDTKVDSFQSSDSNTGVLDYVAVVFPYPVLVSQIVIHLGTFPDGGWWGTNAGPGTGNPLSASHLTEPAVQVSQQTGYVGLNWTTIEPAPHTDYVTVLTGHVLGAPLQAPRTNKILFDFESPVSGRAFRLIGIGGGRPAGRGLSAGFICVYEIVAFYTTAPTLTPTQAPTSAPTPRFSTTHREELPDDFKTISFDKTKISLEELDTTLPTSEAMVTTLPSTLSDFISTSEEENSPVLLNVTIAVVIITLLCLVLLAAFYVYQRRSARKSGRQHGKSGVRSPRTPHSPRAPHSPRSRSTAPSTRTSHYKSGRRSARRSVNYGFIPVLGGDKSGGTSTDVVVMSTYATVGELEEAGDTVPRPVVGVYRPVNVDEEGNGYDEIPGTTPTASTNDTEYAVGDLAAATKDTEYGPMELPTMSTDTTATEYGVGDVSGTKETAYAVGDLSR